MTTKKLLTVLIAALLSTVCNNIFAYDFAVANDDGVTIYYNYINDGKELEVTFANNSYNSYSGIIVIPKEVTYANRILKVTSIGSSAFSKCSSLTSVTIPESVTSIGYSTFYDCSSLTSITIPESVTSISQYAFSDCSSLTSITIPESVTSIGSSAFNGCSSLTSITIPESVTSIGSSAFNGCSSLTSITIPESVTNIGLDAFTGTAWLDNQPDGLVYAGNVAYRYKGSMPENTSIEIKEGTSALAYGVFSGCTNLTSITIPESVTSIDSSAFQDCI